MREKERKRERERQRGREGGWERGVRAKRERRHDEGKGRDTSASA